VKLIIEVAYLQPSGEQVNETIITNVGTICAWEKHSGRSSASLHAKFDIRDLVFMAWHKLTKLGKETRSYDDFEAIVEDLKLQDSAPSNPTEAAASDAS
jgi:hypothetical protein